MSATPPQPWTQRREAELREARARVEWLEQQRTYAIERVAKAAGMSSDMAVLALIENADAVRDALEPFDSGGRAACSPPQFQPQKGISQ